MPIFEPYIHVPTPYRYYQNNFDVTWYILNNIAPPLSERFFEVTCR